ncbi:MAG: glycosyltransferase family 4 protein [Bryobacteraceae bacterium]|nr:glycosyltransferase family 4 protein [Bryobacteraceae bacterium]
MPEKRPAVVVISPEAPYPLVGGGQHRTACLVEYLARRYTVDLVLFRQAGEPDPAGALPLGLVRRQVTLELPRHSKLELARAVRNARRVMRGVPPLNERFSGFGREIEAFTRRERYAAGVIEHFWCVSYWEQIAGVCGRTVLDLHNVESVLLERMAAVETGPRRWMLRRFAREAEFWERRWLPKFDLLLAASDGDARRAAEKARGARVHVYPNTLPDRPQPEVEEEEAIAFSGNFEYAPNRDGAVWFAREIWPRLKARRPELEWRLIGRNAEGLRHQLGSQERIQICGAVEDPVGELARCKAAVVPLRAASGTRVKILEAWAAGRAVVSTTIGAEGLEARQGEQVVLADDAEEFAGAVLRLLEAEEERRRLGQAGRALFERRYTRQAGWAALRAAEL